MAQREDWIDVTKGAAITLVVLGHAIRGVGASGTALPEIWARIDSLIYAFHMPLFFALSGWFFIASIAKRGFAEFTRGRLLRILYPMILWTYIFFAFKLLAGNLSNSPIDLASFPLIPVPGQLHFWFLWDLLILSFLFYPIRFLMQEGRVPPMIWVLLVVITLTFATGAATLPPAVTYWSGSVVWSLPFFLLGVFLGQEGLMRKLRPVMAIPALMLFAAILLIWEEVLGFGYQQPAAFILVLCCLTIFAAMGPLMTGKTKDVPLRLGTASMTIYVAHTIFSAGLREALQVAGLADPHLHVLLGTLAGIVGPLVLLAVAQRLGITGLLGLEIPTSRAARV